MPQPLKILLQRCNELNRRDDLVRQFFRPSSAGASKLPRHRFARDLDPADVAVKHDAKSKASDPAIAADTAPKVGSRPSSALPRSASPLSPMSDSSTCPATFSASSAASGGDAVNAEIVTAKISWGTTVETTLAAMTGGASNNEDTLQRLLAAKRSALMQRLDPDGQFAAAALELQQQVSPLHHRALSPSKGRSSPSKQPSPLQRKFSVRPSSAAASYAGGVSVVEDSDAEELHAYDDNVTAPSASPVPAPSQLLAASSPAARRLERFAAVDARLSQTIHHLHTSTLTAAASPGEPQLRLASPAPSRPSSAAASSRASHFLPADTGDQSNKAEMYFLQVQVDNSTCGFSDRFDCIIMTHGAADRRPYTASFPQLLMSKDRYLLFPCKPKMWQGLPTDKVFGSGVARMTDFDPRTVLSMGEYLPWVSQPSQLLGKSFRVQVFCRVKRDNARRCIVDKLITFNDDFTVDTREYPESIKGQRDGQQRSSAAAKQRPQSAML